MSGAEGAAGAAVRPEVSALSGVDPIVVEGVTKRFGDFQALDGIDLRIHQGDFFALLGPNGAGKTTLISIIAGLAHASSGRVSVMGHDVVKDYRRARASLGVVPQELVFDPFFTVRETLRITAGYYGVRGADAWIDEVLEGLGLTDKAESNMRALSGGMKRRVMVAQALIHRPPVIVLDEPTAGVDIELRQSLWRFVRKLNHDGHTIVLTTHYLEEAQALCNRVAVMKAGRIVALDETDALLKRFSAGALLLRISGGTLPASLQAWRPAPPPGGGTLPQGAGAGRGGQDGGVKAACSDRSRPMPQRLSGGFGHALQGAATVVLPFLLVLDDLPVELVDEGVDGGIEVGVGGFGKDLAPGDQQLHFGALHQLLDREDDVDVDDLIEVVADPAQLGGDVLAQGGGDFHMVSTDGEVHAWYSLGEGSTHGQWAVIGFVVARQEVS